MLVIGCLLGILAPRAERAAALIRSEENTIRVFQLVSPGVVNITTTSIGRDFFYNPVPTEGSGSGVIVNKSGHIVTSYHVVQGSSHLEVTLADGSRWQASVVGTSPSNDLAVIKIEAPPNLHNESYLRAKRDRMGHILHHQGLALDEEMIHTEKLSDRSRREQDGS